MALFFFNPFTGLMCSQYALMWFYCISNTGVHSAPFFVPVILSTTVSLVGVHVVPTGKISSVTLFHEYHTQKNLSDGSYTLD